MPRGNAISSNMNKEVRFKKLTIFTSFFCSVWKSNVCLSFQIVTDFLGVINTSTIYKIRKSF